MSIKRKTIMSLVLGIGLTITIFTNGYADTQLVINDEPNIIYEQSSYNATSSSSSSSKKWYYNTGTSLPKTPNYSKYNLSNYLNKGDIIYEKNGGFGITGHIAIVEGRFYDTSKKIYYYRIIEAIDDGVVRSVLDDERIVDKGVSIYRVKSATIEQKNRAVEFCKTQLGKGYFLDFKKDKSANEKDWYCSELVWAAYINQGIDIETTRNINEPGITPRDICNSKFVSHVVFK